MGAFFLFLRTKKVNAKIKDKYHFCAKIKIPKKSYPLSPLTKSPIAFTVPFAFTMKIDFFT
jgi:hypothetical protein